MKTRYTKCFTLLIIAAVGFTACKKDPFDGVQTNERSIEAYTLPEGQIGPAVVDQENSSVTIKVLEGTDLTKVKAIVQASYKATVSPSPDQEVNFAASNNKVVYTITSEKGETRNWTVELVPFQETIIGTYNVTDLVVYGGTGPEWGGGGVIKMADKPWVWPADDGPQAELDNTLTMEFTGATAEGNTYGKFVNSAGADGKYADFRFVGNPQTDVNKFYRVMPKGEGTWTRNYAEGTVTFTFADGSTKVGYFREGPYTYKDDYSGSGNMKDVYTKTVAAGNASFEFNLVGAPGTADDWGSIYNDIDKFVKRPRRFWVDVKRTN
ncbi:hypothetical protein EOD41_03415 [Mucilaginibacter limnophilus]|uniref:Uncharacterized protein n=1 Tax=Mucilaginibacter limnophilus TaxID=1932778 RepID=A0A3S3TKA2_9SPHI|nr:hypothetical protein [Mucilaginibacter limnophilus]RVU02996.1 hypothetical protein EOD41_03415 [Mucilaginibacter limnophilus]